MTADIIFIALAVILLSAAGLAVWLKNVFYNALALILCLFCVAGLFIYLNSEFLAIMEIIIYIGAISIAIIFAIMLSKPMFQKREIRSSGKILRSVIISALLFFGLNKAIHNSQWPAAALEGDYSMQAIGRMLLKESALPFEAVSLVLLVAIIGALVISNTKDSAS
jgi:NADH-quinone oxidoreductase subunit J